MKRTITTVKRYINEVEVTREELLSRKISNPVLEHLYQTAVQRVSVGRKQGTEKKIS